MSRNLDIIAGPNGAGKTTFAREFLPDFADCRNFVNADLIAQGVSPFSPETAAFRAGRVMLNEIGLLARRGVDFGFETTLSGRSYLNLIRDLKGRNYAVHIYFLWVPTVDLALSRVRSRVLNGGHDVPSAVVRRRFARSARNFFLHYRRLADSWLLFDNSGSAPSLIASNESGNFRIMQEDLYNELISRHTEGK